MRKAGKKMTPKRTESNPDLFEISLVQVINLNHPLVKLSSNSTGKAFAVKSSHPFAMSTVNPERIFGW
jgi:hypothetical protein